MAFYDVNVESKNTIAFSKISKSIGKKDFLHLDFMAVKAKTHVEVEIPLKFVGRTHRIEIWRIDGHLAAQCKDFLPGKSGPARYRN
jgi:hypothetical protein